MQYVGLCALAGAQRLLCGAFPCSSLPVHARYLPAVAICQRSLCSKDWHAPKERASIWLARVAWVAHGCAFGRLTKRSPSGYQNCE